MGVQEFISSTASIANGAVHAWYLQSMLRHRRSWMAKAATSGRVGAMAAGGGCGGGSVVGGGVINGVISAGEGGGAGAGSPFATLWMCIAWVSINAWVWSCIFHARDTSTTRTMDYASVGGLRR